MDERTGPGAAFVLRMVVDLVSALVAIKVIKKKHATALLDDSLANVIENYPEYEQELREIAATATAQIELVSLDVDRKLGKPG